jgi:hypothetical protein
MERFGNARGERMCRGAAHLHESELLGGSSHPGADSDSGADPHSGADADIRVLRVGRYEP